MARVLIVDDSEDLQDALQMLLIDEGFEVSFALDGARGLQLTLELSPDVILLDMMMPEMDGLEFLSRLSTHPSRPLVVAQSGFPDFREEALRRGAHAFLVKPLSAELLLSALRAAIEHSQVAQAVITKNAAEAEQARRTTLEHTTSAVSQIDSMASPVCGDMLERIVRWMPTYFGFGTGLVTILREGHCCVEAVHGGMASKFDVGGRYPRETFFCDDVIAAGSTLLLSDPVHHPCEHFSHHKALEHGPRFYAGVPLTAPSHAVLGTLCIVDSSPHAFSSEDMHVLEALGLGTARGLETGSWPIDEDGVFTREYLDLFVEVAVARSTREGGSAVVLRLPKEWCALVQPAKAVSGVRFDGQVAFIWSGPAGDWVVPETVVRLGVARLDLSGVREGDEARARLRAMCA